MQRPPMRPMESPAGTHAGHTSSQYATGHHNFGFQHSSFSPNPINAPQSASLSHPGSAYPHQDLFHVAQSPQTMMSPMNPMHQHTPWSSVAGGGTAAAVSNPTAASTVHSNQVRSYFKSTPFGGHPTSPAPLTSTGHVMGPAMNLMDMPRVVPGHAQDTTNDQPSNAPMSSIYDLMSVDAEPAGLSANSQHASVGMPAASSGFTPLRARSASRTGTPQATAVSPMSVVTSPVRHLNAEFPNTVTVFGFPPEASPFILSLFRHFGTILNYQHVGNSNWMNIEFETETAAQMALGKNGMIVGGDCMVGVVPMKRSHVSCAAAEKSLSNLLSPLRSSSSPVVLVQKQSGQQMAAVASPLVVKAGASNKASVFQPQSSSTGQGLGSTHSFTTSTTTSTVHRGKENEAGPSSRPTRSIVNGLLESVFGWG